MLHAFEEIDTAKTVTLREASQAFSRCVREVEAVEEFVITRDGKPVARLVPAGNRRVPTRGQEAAWARARARMEKGWSLGGERFDRDALHERG